MLVADEVDLLDADLFALVYGEVDPDGIADDGVPLDFCLDLAEQESLLRKIALDDVGGGLLHIFGELTAAAEVQPLLDVLALAGLDPAERPAGHARTLLDVDGEPGGVARGVEAVDGDLDIFEIALQPKAADRSGDVFTRHLHGHALAQSGLGDDLLVAEIGVARHGQATDIVCSRMGIIHFDPLRPAEDRCEQQRQKSQNPSYSHFHSINVQIYPII